MIPLYFALFLQFVWYILQLLFFLLFGVFIWIFSGHGWKNKFCRFLGVCIVVLLVWVGYMVYDNSDKLFDKQDQNQIQTIEYVCIANEFINIRTSPNTKASVLGKVMRGESVYVLEIKEGFAKVKYGAGYGYANAKYIKIKNK